MSSGAEEACAEGRAAVMAARDEYEAAADQWNAALLKGSSDHRHLAMTMHEAQLRLDEIKGTHPAAWAEIQAEDRRMEDPGYRAEAAAGHGDFLHELREAAERTDQARLSGDTSRIAAAGQAEWGLTQAAMDEAAEKEPEAGA